MTDRILFRLSFVIECKLSRDKPWVLFTSQEARLADPARVAQRVGSQLARQLLHKVADNEQLQCQRLLQIGERAAYGLTQAFTSGQDVTYAAVTSVAKAALAKALNADEVSETQFPVCEIVFPIVVIDGRLFESYLTDKSMVVVSEISSGVLLWRNPLVKQPHSIIQVMTISALDAYIREARNLSDYLLDSYGADLVRFQTAQEMKKQIDKLGERFSKQERGKS